MNKETYVMSTSSQIQKFRHDSETNTLHIVFRSNNKHYAYSETTVEEFQAMSEAPSHGKWFNDSIKGIKPYMEVI